jgi:hypothetical protein
MAEHEPRVRDMFPSRRKRGGVAVALVVLLLVGGLGVLGLRAGAFDRIGGPGFGTSRSTGSVSRIQNGGGRTSFVPDLRRRVPLDFGRLQVSLVSFNQVRERVFVAKLRLEKKEGLGTTKIPAEEFVVAGPGGERRFPSSGRSTIAVGTEEPTYVSLRYALPDAAGEYRLVWMREGKTAGSWAVHCHRCE